MATSNEPRIRGKTNRVALLSPFIANPRKGRRAVGLDLDSPAPLGHSSPVRHARKATAVPRPPSVSPIGIIPCRLSLKSDSRSQTDQSGPIGLTRVLASHLAVAPRDPTSRATSRALELVRSSFQWSLRGHFRQRLISSVLLWGMAFVQILTFRHDTAWMQPGRRGLECRSDGDGRCRQLV